MINRPLSKEQAIARDFAEIENIEKGGPIAIADTTIVNKGKRDEFLRDLEALFEKKSKKRMTWDEYFIKITTLVAERSTCVRHHVGAVIVKEKNILATGYNGAATGLKDCSELGCMRDALGIKSGTRQEICRAIHAEQNAIIRAALNGVSIKDSTLYCTHSPCILCAKMIVNSGIKRVVAYMNYPSKDSLALFKAAKVKFERIKRPDSKINFLD